MRVNFDSKALRDTRFKRLAKRLGVPMPHVYGACLMVWHECYERLSPEIDRETADALAELDGFNEALIACDLADEVDSEMIRVRGVDERIEVLAKKREASKLGVEARKRGQPRGRPDGQPYGSENGKRADNDKPSGHQVIDQYGQPDDDPSDPLVLWDQSTHTARARGEAEVVVVQTPPPRDWRERKRAIVRAIAPLHAERFNALRTKLGLAVPAMQPIGDPAERALSKLLEGIPDLDGVEDKCRHAIAIREAEAERDISLRWFGAVMWTEEQFARAVSMTLDDVHRKRAGPPSARPAEPPAPARRRL